MPMPYRDLLQVLEAYGFGEVVRIPKESPEIGVIASKRQPPVWPFAFPCRDIILENGDNSIIDDEVVAALFRWIEKQTGEKVKPC